MQPVQIPCDTLSIILLCLLYPMHYGIAPPSRKLCRLAVLCCNKLMRQIQVNTLAQLHFHIRDIAQCFHVLKVGSVSDVVMEVGHDRVLVYREHPEGVTSWSGRKRKMKNGYFYMERVQDRVHYLSVTCLIYYFYQQMTITSCFSLLFVYIYDPN